MMLFIGIITFFFLQFQGLDCQALDANGVSLAEKVLYIERLMLTPGSIDFQVGPCDFLLNGPPTNISGDLTAAEWIRTVFHDFITADVAKGIGGLDASIGFEADRQENLGGVEQPINGPSPQNFANRTIIGFNLFSTLFISTSDFIALGLAEAILSCDPNSPMIKLRAGRTDATAAGPTGVPGPGDLFTSQLADFARAGFNKTEMITAVACGHTIGGVHKINFPEIVGNQTTIGNGNASEGITGDMMDTFDDTPTTFDHIGLQNYLAGTHKAGGPLVTTSNPSFRSDLNIFESDNNDTVRAMSSSLAAFEAACFPVFEKMINTVPNGTVLSDVIGPRQWITMESHLDLDSTGVVLFSGVIGHYTGKGGPPSPATATYQYGTIGGGNTGPKVSHSGVPTPNIIDLTNNATRFPFFGNGTNYTFSDTLTTPTINSFIITEPGATFTEPINLNLFVVPSLSCKTTTGVQPQYTVTAALLTSLSSAETQLTATLYFSAGQPLSNNPVYLQQNATLTKQHTTKGAYTIFQGTVTRPNVDNSNGGGGSHIDVRLGSTQRSAKVQVDGAPLPNLFPPC